MACVSLSASAGYVPLFYPTEAEQLSGRSFRSEEGSEYAGVPPPPRQLERDSLPASAPLAATSAGSRLAWHTIVGPATSPQTVLSTSLNTSRCVQSLDIVYDRRTPSCASTFILVRRQLVISLDSALDVEGR